MPEAATGGVLWKNLFLKILKNLQETSVPEETPVNFAKFLRAAFLQSKSEQLLLKRGQWKPKQEKKIVFVVERWVVLITSAKIPDYEESISSCSFYGHLTNY